MRVHSQNSVVILMVQITCTTPELIVAQSLYLSPSTASRELEKELQGKTMEELEQICEDRGFEVIKDEIDPETGQSVVSTHQDYVDAAWQCLQLYVLLTISLLSIFVSGLCVVVSFVLKLMNFGYKLTYDLESEDVVMDNLRQQIADSASSSSSSSLLSASSFQLEDIDHTSSKSDSLRSLVEREEEHLQYDNNGDLRMIQRFVRQIIPLPRPFQNLFAQLLKRLVKDVKEHMFFVRRQLDAIVRVLRGRIDDTPSSSSQQLFPDEEGEAIFEAEPEM